MKPKVISGKKTEKETSGGGGGELTEKKIHSSCRFWSCHFRSRSPDRSRSASSLFNVGLLVLDQTTEEKQSDVVRRGGGQEGWE